MEKRRFNIEKIMDKAGIIGIYFLLVVAVALSVYAITICRNAYFSKPIVEQNTNQVEP